MQFLNEIREHLANFETEAKEEIHKFIDWLHTKYVPPGAPVVAPPETSYVQTTPSYVAPVVENVPAPVADAAPAADSNPAPVSDVPVAAQDEFVSVADAPVVADAVAEESVPVVEAANGNT